MSYEYCLKFNTFNLNPGRKKILALQNKTLLP